MSSTLDSLFWLTLAALVLSGASLMVLFRFSGHLPHALPGPRSLHQRPVPRVGGLAIWVGFLPAALLAPPQGFGSWTVWLAAWLLIVIVSLADDWRGVPAGYRLGSHALGAAAVATAMAAGAAPWLLIAASAFLIVWAANLYNFMDGSDGMAAAMAICGFAAYGLAALHAGASAALYLALAAATLAFFLVNLPPARMFMGDVGAVPLGFLAAALGVAGWESGVWPAWFPLLVFMPFVADATVTLCKRILRRERVWEAHKGHYYQRFNQLGAGHSGTLAFFGVLMVGTASSALVTLAIDRAAGWMVTAAWILVLCALFLGIDYHWRRR